MGLDITAYSRLDHVGKHVDTDWCEDESHVSAFAYDCFPQSFRGIPILGTKTSGGTAFFEGGCYAITDKSEEHDFRAGSYGGYNAWRTNLAEQFNPHQDAASPFYELIWFADNEGTIGPEAAADLLADFREHAAAYVPLANWGEIGVEKYRDWTRACELAADCGLIWFH